MSNVTTINNVEVQEVLYKGQRVVTRQQIAELHDMAVGSVKDAHIAHAAELVEGEDFYTLSGNDLIGMKETSPNLVSKFAPSVILYTESGYLTIAMTFRGEVAARVRREMKKAYFTMKAQVQPAVFDVQTAMQIILQDLVRKQDMSATKHELAEVAAKVDRVAELIEDVWTPLAIHLGKIGFRGPKDASARLSRLLGQRGLERGEKVRMGAFVVHTYRTADLRELLPNVEAVNALLADCA